MALDFKLVESRNVGYRIKADSMDGPNRLESLTFGEFIPPYACVSKTYKQLYQIIGDALKSARKQQDSVISGQRSVMVDGLATATLDREAMMNTMQLIQKFYL
jgi:hypothetical protein